MDNLDTYSQKVLQSEGAMQAFVANMREAYKGETESILQDIHLMISDWGFDLSDMQTHGKRHDTAGTSKCIKLWHAGEMQTYAYRRAKLFIKRWKVQKGNAQ